MFLGAFSRKNGPHFGPQSYIWNNMGAPRKLLVRAA